MTIVIDLDDRDIAVRINQNAVGGTEQVWHPQTEGHLIHETALNAPALVAQTLADTLAEQTPHVWRLTAPMTAGTPKDHIQVMEAVWRFIIQRVSLVDGGQAAARDFTPAYLVVEPLADVVDALSHAHRRSLQQLSSIARRGRDGNVYLAAFTPRITSARVPHELRQHLHAPKVSSHRSVDVAFVAGQGGVIAAY